MEVFEREHERLRAGACEHPSDHCGELAASQLVGRKFRRVDTCVGNIEQGASSGANSTESSFTWVRVDSRSASRDSGATSGPPNRCFPHSTNGWSAVFCSNCDEAHSTQEWGVSASRPRNSSMRRDLPRPGSPTI